jgi:hypothetical protein
MKLRIFLIAVLCVFLLGCASKNPAGLKKSPCAQVKQVKNEAGA